MLINKTVGSLDFCHPRGISSAHAPGGLLSGLYLVPCGVKTAAFRHSPSMRAFVRKTLLTDLEVPMLSIIAP